MEEDRSLSSKLRKLIEPSITVGSISEDQYNKYKISEEFVWKEALRIKQHPILFNQILRILPLYSRVRTLISANELSQNQLVEMPPLGGSIISDLAKKDSTRRPNNYTLSQIAVRFDVPFSSLTPNGVDDSSDFLEFHLAECGSSPFEMAISRQS